MRRTELAKRAMLIAALAAAALSGACTTDMYGDRRDPVSFAAGDAVATNIAIQTVDPWPAHAANRDIAFNGERMQSAIERYRTNKVTPPVGTSTSSVQYDPAAQQPAPAPTTK
jgi:hypothetical protein